jgi:uncharacterized protein YyaL (SSP411 family)
MANRLAKETSPYLLQHAENPVEWYPWGAEALAAAKAANKPLLVSIGYSSCHWCHVMAHESFEDAETAALMNDLFINVKVDREERPDIDAIYMTAVQAITGQGGWPLTAFLTPDGVPFYGGTYWPPEDRQGMPAFARVLEAVHEAWRDKPEDVADNAQQVLAMLEAASAAPKGRGDLNEALLEAASKKLVRQFDGAHGGFGGAPKFPQASVLDFLLRLARRGDERARAMVEITLQRMGVGGIVDQIGGGFHRYAVDAIWLVPHFEKMLYDNGQLARIYLDAWKLTGNAFYRDVAVDTIDYVLREMTGKGGQFFAAQDADSEGVEGKYFVWTPDEVKKVLGKTDGEYFCSWFDITAEGNFEGHSIPHPVLGLEDMAAVLGQTTDEAAATIDGWKVKLRKARAKRVKPGRDEKVILAWNGMMLRAIADAAAALDRDDYRAAAVANAEFLCAKLRDKKGRWHRVRTGTKLGPVAFLEDLANLADGLFALYTATFDQRWLDEAFAILDQVVAEFADEAGAGFFDAGSQHEQLIARPRETQDGATPSGNGIVAGLLLKRAAMTGNREDAARAGALLQAMASVMAEQPIGYGRHLCAVDTWVSAAREVAIVGAADDPATRALARAVAERYEPNAVVALAAPGDEAIVARLPFLAHRPMRDGVATAYVCERHTCLLPVTKPGALAAQLAEGVGVMWTEY